MDQVNQQVRFVSIKTSKTFLIVPSATTRAYSSNESIIVFIVRVVIVLATTEEPVNVAHRIRLCDVMVSGVHMPSGIELHVYYRAVRTVYA